MKYRQTGIRVKLSLWISYPADDLAALVAAIAASAKLLTREGLAKLAELPDVEIEESSAKNTTREAAGP
jgi:hypothetical protein